jgi:hypothetical protein
MYGRSFAENEDVLDKCQKFLMNPVPGLTAVCMMVTIDYWNKYGNYYEVMGGFLDIARFDTWYDEIIFTAGFINRNKENIRFPTSLLDKFEKMTSDPRFKELDIL